MKLNNQSRYHDRHIETREAQHPGLFIRTCGGFESVGRWVGKVGIATKLLFVVIPSRLTKSSRKYCGVQVAFGFSYIFKNIQATLI